MKPLLAVIFLFGMVLNTQAQVMIRNTFTLGKNHKIKNLGISFVSINLDRHPNMNMMMNGRGGKSLIIDVAALTNWNKEYTYREIAERIYTPGGTYRPNQDAVPLFLLLEPPRLRVPSSVLDIRTLHLRSVKM